MCPFPGDSLLSDNVSECFCKERFLCGLPRTELCLRHRVSSASGRWSGSPVGSMGQCHKQGDVIAPRFHAAASVIIQPSTSFSHWLISFPVQFDNSFESQIICI